MSNMYSSLRLLGYKINELPNGYFITKNPNGKQSLFDNDGKIVITNTDSVTPLSDYLYYSVEHIQYNVFTHTLYNRQGDILGKVDEEYLGLLDDYVVTIGTDKFNNTIHNVYDKQNKYEFKNIQGEPASVIKDDDGYKLIYAEPNKSMFMIDSKGNKVKLPVRQSKFISANKNYILCEDGTYRLNYIVDYDGNEICGGNAIIIDDLGTNNSNIISLEGNYIDIINNKGKVIKKIQNPLLPKDSECIKGAEFTSKPDVICMNRFTRDYYLFNINTLCKSKKYYDIDTETFIGVTKGKNKDIVLIDRKTLKETVIFSNCTSFEYDYNMYVVTKVDSNGNEIEEYYTHDFRQLIHEFRQIIDEY